MKLLTFTYVATGYNRAVIVNRMRASGVDVLKMLIIDEKRTEITISAKDRAKYFAICKNIWYNELIRTGGLLACLYSIGKAPFLVVGALAFLAVVLFGGNLYMGSDYLGDSALYRAEIEETFEEVGIKEYRLFNEEQLKTAQEALGKKLDAVFFKIDKSGNRAIITAYSAITTPNRMESTDKDLVSSGNFRILKLTAYGGTPEVKEGDEVTAGQTIIGAYEVLKDGSTRPCKIVACVSAEFKFEYRYTCSYEPSDGDKERTKAVAKFLLGDESVTREDVYEDGNVIVAVIYYEKIIFGERFGG